MKPEDMNTINADGKAFNGNRGAIVVAYAFLAALAIAGLVAVLKAIF